MFDKLFWIHNLNIKYIILGFDHCFLFKKEKKVTFHTHTYHITKNKVTLYFYNIYENAIVFVFVFIENENVEKLYSFFIFKSNS